ncbi:serine-threonine protein kinase 19-domain-containing protein [Sporodiniella umbellata]|nr:serine-threonine protein kinase 19-domain-containing protein [Sporodiniella umbellata]
MHSKRIKTEQSIYKSQQTIKKPDVYGHSREKAKKIRRSLTTKKESGLDGTSEDDTIAWQIPPDSAVAANYIIQLNSTNIPICFAHQLYSVLPNATLVDKELQGIIKEGNWRRFHMIGFLEEESVIMRTSDYVQAIKKSREQEAMKGDTQCLNETIFDKYIDILKEKEYYTQTSISVESMYEFGLDDKVIKQLVKHGFLLPHIQENLYWFSIKNQGCFMANIRKGREEILKIIKKRTTKDIMENVLKAKKLRNTILSVDFLLHDLIGSGRVERYSIGTMGSFIKLTNKN